MVERTCGGCKANAHTALPVASLLVKNKVCPTRRQLNVSPALLVSHFRVSHFRNSFQSLTKAHLPHPEPHAMKTSQQCLRRLGDKSTLGKAEGLPKADRPGKWQSWDENSIFLMPKKEDCGPFPKESCFKWSQWAEIYVL